ncbi:MAG: site-specific DNA-methyltransferase [Chloroflexi bacterium]|nr:site-specific DNA-methyltransferase [Chloroflexota bacterium]
MNITYLSQQRLLPNLEMQPSDSVEFLFLVTGAMGLVDAQFLEPYLDEAVRVLKQGGVLFIQGLPCYLAEVGVFLDKRLTFKYWFAFESDVVATTGLPTVHAGVLLFVKGNGRFNIKRTRLPHQYCRACGRTLKDWGGKSHLMHPDGYAVSDVIKDLPPANNYSQISRPVFDLLLSLLDFTSRQKNNTPQLIGDLPPQMLSGIVAPTEGLSWHGHTTKETPHQYQLPLFFSSSSSDKVPIPTVAGEELYDVILYGDALEILRQYPDESVDLVFADPPYNLDKAYSTYSDDKKEQLYIQWCDSWLNEYARILKPTGSLFVLNLPRWAMHHAAFLNKRLYFQNWIVWDALSEPRGKIMPAHYALLFYTKQQKGFTFNYGDIRSIDARHYCLRASCRRERKKDNDDDKVDLNDIWWDIHRIKHRRNRDHHPCQLPDPLMERIIKLTTNPGDVVLDAFAGAGTTPVVARQLGRRYVAIDLDPNYIEIMQQKMAQLSQQGFIFRPSSKQTSWEISKKELQIELRDLAAELGYLPTPNDVQKYGKYTLDVYFKAFPTWGKALKAAKLEIGQ